MDDINYNDILNFLNNDDYPESENNQSNNKNKSNWRKKCRKFEYDKNSNELFFHSPPNKKLRVIQLSEMEEILKQSHINTEGKHLGLNKTRTEVSKKYYWKTITKNVTEFYSKCIDCPASSTNSRIKVFLQDIEQKSPTTIEIEQNLMITNDLELKLIDSSSNDWILNVVVPFKQVTNRGNNAIALLVHKKTGWVEARAITKLLNTDDTCQLILDTICKHSFINKIYLYDYDSTYINRIQKCINSNINIKINLEKYLENTEQTKNIKEVMKHLNENIHEYYHIWDKCLDKFIFAINTYSSNEAQSSSSFKKLYDKEPHLGDEPILKDNIITYTLDILRIFYGDNFEKIM